MPLSKDTLLQGGKYRIIRFISSGGFGCTYEGVHTMMDSRVAIKEFFVKDFCNRDEHTSHVTIATRSKQDLVMKLRQKFIDEARAVFKMQHPNIVRVTDIFEENGTAYYVMDYIDGSSLHEMVKQRGALPEKEAVGYIRQIADALKYVHSRNRLHLDIKPGNIMVDSHGKAILLDFGTSKHYDEDSGENTSTLMGVNTKGYAPVEQSTQSFTTFSPATDIYALGATLYKLLTGKTPPDSVSLMSEDETLHPLPTSISSPVRKAVMAAMQVRRKNRPQSVSEFLALLNDSEEVSEEGDTVLIKEEFVRQPSNRPAPVRPNSTKPEQKHKPWLYWIYAFVGVAMAISLAASLFVPGKKPIPDEKPISDAEEKSLYADVKFDSSSNTIICGSYSYKMVYVSGGTFTMGATSEQGSDAWEDEKPAHSVTLSSYYIGQTEVPQWLWIAVMGSNPSYWKGDNLPVEEVSWSDCQTFISKLNSLTGKNFALPTEAQWEFAARGGNKSRRYKYSGRNNLENVAWYYENSGGKTHDVATKSTNELGLYDMSGNVWEWCSDWYGSYSSFSQTDPRGAEIGSDRVCRGGGWIINACYCRVSSRSSDVSSGSNDIGLRLVLRP